MHVYEGYMYTYATDCTLKRHSNNTQNTKHKTPSHYKRPYVLISPTHTHAHTLTHAHTHSHMHTHTTTLPHYLTTPIRTDGALAFAAAARPTSCTEKAPRLETQESKS
jgi:hypothetical protein